MMKTLFHSLASLRLAVAVMAALALASVLATFYESSAGTAAAQQEFYGAGWFASLLAMLGANVLASMLKRYPWKAHHAGFVIAHLGILSLLVGSLISVHFGLDSSLALYEGEMGDHVALAGEGEAPLPFRASPCVPGRGADRRWSGLDVLSQALPGPPARREGPGREAAPSRRLPGLLSHPSYRRPPRGKGGTAGSTRTRASTMVAPASCTRIGLQSISAISGPSSTRALTRSSASSSAATSRAG